MRHIVSISACSATNQIWARRYITKLYHVYDVETSVKCVYIALRCRMDSATFQIGIWRQQQEHQFYNTIVKLLVCCWLWMKLLTYHVYHLTTNVSRNVSTLRCRKDSATFQIRIWMQQQEHQFFNTIVKLIVWMTLSTYPVYHVTTSVKMNLHYVVARTVWLSKLGFECNNKNTSSTQ